MRDSENTKVGGMRVLAQNNFQIVADSRGFTLIEIIMVVVLIGILAVSVVPKFVDTSAISLQGGAAMVRADIRYTQELAMSTHAPKTITFTTNDTFYTPGCPFPAGQPLPSIPWGSPLQAVDPLWKFRPAAARKQSPWRAIRGG
jgi:prepilin-type N-terminal cleavage/methylation domain-containing protein